MFVKATPSDGSGDFFLNINYIVKLKEIDYGYRTAYSIKYYGEFNQLLSADISKEDYEKIIKK
jgi:hypothetical protein